MSYIIAIETAVPAYCHSQNAITSFFQHKCNDENMKRKLKFISSKSGIQKRYSVLNDFNEQEGVLFQSKTDHIVGLTSRMNVYKNNALNLALSAINKIENFESIKKSITHIITVTCTGLFAPGLDIDLIELLNISPKTQRSSINFMGCNAAIIALNQANNICKSIPDSNVLVVCVELCTIHFQNNASDENILSNAIFADGASVAIVSSDPLTINHSPILKINSFNSIIVHKGKSDMTWQLSETGFIMNLTSYVSELINGSIINLLKELEINKHEINYWAIHPGGKKIVDEFASALKLDYSLFNSSYEILKNYGNMSSATILFVIKHLITTNLKAKSNETIFSAAFGPGLSIETMQLQYVKKKK